MAAKNRPLHYNSHTNPNQNSSPNDSQPPLPDDIPLSNVPLTFLEKKLFDLLIDVTKQNDTPPVTLRVAGGWVRDKILYPSRDLGTHVDIDIALDTMLGIEFAEKINLYLVRNHMKKGSVGLIQKNPDQSKHLETATMRVMDVCLDLVNLRTETYSHDSRIPNIQIGTPREDAMRRDLTINALFYNIASRTLEDFTDKGFDDIRARIIRTPLPPLTTLLDDPLRALRAIRFASRLNFKFDPALFEACRDSRVHEALGAKVSRERISAEIDRVIASDRAAHGVGLVVELRLFPIVFRLPSDDCMVGSHRPPLDLPGVSLGALLNLHSLSVPKPCETPRRLVRYAALLSPLASCKCLHAEAGKRKKEIAVAHYILRAELRLSAKDVTGVCRMHAAALDLKALVHKGAAKLDRLETGRALRAAGPGWRSALQIALIMELRPSKAESTYEGGMRDDCEEMCSEYQVLVETYRRFKENVEGMRLEGVWDLKPPVNGNELLKILPRVKRGPKMGEIMEEQVDWIIENPGRSAHDVKVWLKDKYAEYG